MGAIETILEARYPRPNDEAFDALYGDASNPHEATAQLLVSLRRRIAKPYTWAGYELPDDVVELAESNRTLALDRIEQLTAQTNLTKETVRDFFLENHCTFKYAMRRWLLLNPGISIEPITINSETLEPAVITGATQAGAKPGDRVIHLHIVSNNERAGLASAGFQVPYPHWDRSYFVSALRTVDSMLQSNPASTGLFCEYSWVFAPNLHEIGSDGRPYASFSFLKDDAMIGRRFYVGDATPDQYAPQYKFALKNERRRKLHEAREFKPEAWGFFFPKDRLHDYVSSLPNSN